MASDKEQLELELQEKLDNARRQLGEFQTEINNLSKSIDALDVRNQQIISLVEIASQLEVLSDTPLDSVSPFSGKNNDAEAAREEYLQYVNRINEQVNTHKETLANYHSRRLELIEESKPLREEIKSLNDELRKIAPNIREHAVYANGVKVNVLYRSEAILPWIYSVKDRWRNRLVDGAGLILAIIICLLMFLIELPPKPVPEVVEIPPRLAKLLQKKPPPPPPAPPKEEQKPEEPQEKPPEEKKLEPRKQAPAPLNETQKKAREVARRSGLFAAQESFADLLDNDAEQQLGKQARVTSGGEAARQTSRSLVTTSAQSASGGINTAALSRDTAGVGLQGRGTSEVTGVIGGADFADADKPLQPGYSGGRTDEEIQIIFDRSKGALYRYYQRARRSDPTLEGKLVLQLTIEPSGIVSAVSIVSSELEDEALEKRILAKVKTFNFGSKDVPKITINYPIDFIPA